MQQSNPKSVRSGTQYEDPAPPEITGIHNSFVHLWNMFKDLFIYLFINV